MSKYDFECQSSIFGPYSNIEKRKAKHDKRKTKSKLTSPLIEYRKTEKTSCNFLGNKNQKKKKKKKYAGYKQYLLMLIYYCQIKPHGLKSRLIQPDQKRGPACVSVQSHGHICCQSLLKPFICRFCIVYSKILANVRS